MRARLLPLAAVLVRCSSAKTSVPVAEEDSAVEETAVEDSALPELKPAIWINELQASNATTTQDESGAWPDWIELYSGETEPYDLTGCMLTNDLAEPAKQVLSGGTLVPGGFLVLWADGDTDQGDDHLDFRLDADGGEIGLYDVAGRPLTRLQYAAQATDWSAARVPDGSESWVATRIPTPGAENVAEE